MSFGSILDIPASPHRSRSSVSVSDLRYNDRLLPERLKLNVADISLKGKPIATAIIAAGKWYDGEDYHQEYREPFLIPHRLSLTRSRQEPRWIRVPYTPLLLVDPSSSCICV